ncbi:tetratricopeptide repeat protein [bacterium]|nr:tetratricopeptide repeat protein [candidate division CSSED10-310 bacterium]
MGSSGSKGGLFGFFKGADGSGKEITREISALERELKAARRRKDLARVAVTFDRLGLKHLQSGNAPLAQESYLEILKLYNRSKEAGPRKVLATAYNNLGVSYRIQNDLENAAKFIKKSLEVNTQHGHQKEMIVDHYNLAMLKCQEADFENAMDHLYQALTIATRMEDHEWTALLALHRAWIYLYTCRYRDALADYTFVLHQSTALKAIDWMVDAMCGMSRCYQNLGEYYHAHQSAEDVLQLTKERGEDVLEAKALARFSEFLLNLGDPDEARANALRAKELNNESDTATTLLTFRLMALVNAKRGMSDNSRKYLDRAYEICVNVQDRINEAHVLFDMAKLDYDEVKHREALAKAERAAKAIAATRNKELECLNSILKGRIHQAMGDPDRSFRYRQRAMKLAEETGMPDLVWRAHYNLGRLNHAQKRHDEAYSHYHAGIQVLENMAANLRKNALAEVFYRDRERCKIFQDMVLLLALRNRKEEARFYFNRIGCSDIRDKIAHLLEV